MAIDRSRMIDRQEHADKMRNLWDRYGRWCQGWYGGQKAPTVEGFAEWLHGFHYFDLYADRFGNAKVK